MVKCAPKTVFPSVPEQYRIKKKLLIKIIFSISFVIKMVVLISGVRWPLTDHTGTKWSRCKHSKGLRGLNHDFYVPKYRSSGTLPAPEIFYSGFQEHLEDKRYRFLSAIMYTLPSGAVPTQIEYLNFEMWTCQHRHILWH